ncbi:MAG: hypothetical protein IPG79_11675 [Saprospiraceae bacterium]|nr:hypothetical protein [Saprospiraceae bacterium]
MSGIFYDPGETGVDWFHSIIPNFGEGWDMTAFDPSNVTTTPDGARWFDPDDAECAPYLTENLPLICTYTDASGKLQICNMKCLALVLLRWTVYLLCPEVGIG